MRKNKKLLLGGLSVLTLVAAGSGAVSTFAWYQASNTASTTYSKSGQAQTVTVSTSTHDTVSTEFTVNLLVEAVNWSGRNDVSEANDNATANATATMELMAYIASPTSAQTANGAASGINFGYFKEGAAAAFYQQTQFSSPKQDYWKVYRVTVSIADQAGFTASEVVALLNSDVGGYDLSVAADSNSIAYFYTVNTTYAENHTSTNRPEPRATADGSSKSLASNQAFATSATYYFGMYCDGETHDKDADPANTGNFTVTIADHE